MTARRTPAKILVPDAQSATELRPYLDSGGQFRVWLDQRRTDAQRQVDDLTREIETLETDAQRIKADADTAIANLEVDIRARLQRREEHLDILARASAALDLQTPPLRPAPQITEHQEDTP